MAATSNVFGGSTGVGRSGAGFALGRGAAAAVGPPGVADGGHGVAVARGGRGRGAQARAAVVHRTTRGTTEGARIGISPARNTSRGGRSPAGRRALDRV